MPTDLAYYPTCSYARTRHDKLSPSPQSITMPLSACIEHMRPLLCCAHSTLKPNHSLLTHRRSRRRTNHPRHWPTTSKRPSIIPFPILDDPRDMIKTSKPCHKTYAAGFVNFGKSSIVGERIGDNLTSFGAGAFAKASMYSVVINIGEPSSPHLLSSFRGVYCRA